MTSAHKFWAIFWIAFFAATVSVRVASHEGCIAWCTNIATAGAN